MISWIHKFSLLRNLFNQIPSIGFRAHISRAIKFQRWCSREPIFAPKVDSFLINPKLEVDSFRNDTVVDFFRNDPNVDSFRNDPNIDSFRTVLHLPSTSSLIPAAAISPICGSNEGNPALLNFLMMCCGASG